MTNLDDIKTQAKAVEKTAQFITNINKATTNKMVDAYDFSWKGGATRNFSKNSGNYAQGNGSFGGGTSNFKRITNNPQLNSNSNRNIKHSTGIAESSKQGGMPTKTNSSFQSQVYTNQTSPTLTKESAFQAQNITSQNNTTSSNLTSYSQDKFNTGGSIETKTTVSAGTGRASSILHTGNNFAKSSVGNIGYQNSNLYNAPYTRSNLVARHAPNNLPTKFFPSSSNISNTLDSEKIQTGGYTRTNKAEVVKTVGGTVVDFVVQPFQESEAAQGYRKIKTTVRNYSDLTGISAVTSISKNVLQQGMIATSIYTQPRFDTSRLGVNESAYNKITLNSKIDLANKVNIMESRFKELKLDVKNLDAIRMNRLINGESVGVGGKKYKLANAGDREMLREYQKLKNQSRTFGVNNKNGVTKGVLNTGKAWFRVATEESDAGQAATTVYSGVKAGKAVVKGTAVTAKTVGTISGYTLAGAAKTIGTTAAVIGKVGFYYSANPIAKGKWTSVASLKRPMDNITKVLISGSNGIARFSVKNLVRNKIRSKAIVIGKKMLVLGPKNPLGISARGINLLRRQMIAIKSKFISSKLFKVIFKPFGSILSIFVGIKKYVLMIVFSLFFVAACMVLLSIAAHELLSPSDAQYSDTETIDDTGMQEGINWIKGWQDAYEHNLVYCDADQYPDDRSKIGTEEDKRAKDEYSGEYFYKRKIPEKWKEQMEIQLATYGDNAEPDTSEKEKYSNYITSIYDEGDENGENAQFCGYNILHYWGPESRVYKYDAKKYGSRTKKGEHPGFSFFTTGEHIVKNPDGSEYKDGLLVLIKHTASQYKLVGIGSLEKYAGEYKVKPTQMGYEYRDEDGHVRTWPRVYKNSESYQYNGDKQNTDLQVQYIFRGSEKSYEYTENKSLYFIHVDEKTETDYGMYTFYKNMLSCAIAYTGNQEEPQKDFFKDYMWEIFDVNCNGIKGDTGFNTCAQVHIDPSYDASSYFIEENAGVAKRPNIYQAPDGTGVDDGIAVGSWEESAIRWLYCDTDIADAYANLDKYYNKGEIIKWVEEDGYLDQCCWARSCETYPTVDISFKWTGVQDMMYLQKINGVVDNTWSHK